MLSLAAAQHQGGSRVEDGPEQPVGGLAQLLCMSFFHPVFPPPQGNWGQVALLVLVLRAPVSILHLSFLWPKSSSSGLQGPQQKRQRAQRSAILGAALIPGQLPPGQEPVDMRLLHLAGFKMHAESFLNT